MESPVQAGLVSPPSGGCQWWESWAKVPKSSMELQSPSLAKPCGISIPQVGSASPKWLGGSGRTHCS